MATMMLRSRGTIRMRTPAISATMGEISVAVMTMICLEAGLILGAMAQVRAEIDKLSTPKAPFGSSMPAAFGNLLAQKICASFRSAAIELRDFARARWVQPPNDGPHPSILEKSATARVASRI